jgi:hypothetical protein
LILQWSEIDALTRSLLVQTTLLFDPTKGSSMPRTLAGRVGTSLADTTVQLDLVFEERTVQKYAVDNSVGIADLVVAGFDRWNRRQLNTFVVSGRVGSAGSPTYHGSPGCSLATAIVFPTRTLLRSRKGFDQRGAQ